MGQKVLLILVDGMRGDSVVPCKHPYVQTLMSKGSYTLTAQTVMPSVTLPCHMSLFHSVPTERHGVRTNIYTPQVRPINGICDHLHLHGKKASMFYSWEPLRDLSRPEHLSYSSFFSGTLLDYEVANVRLTGDAIKHLHEYEPDFAFLYLGLVDEVGHVKGWMSEEYMASLYQSWDCIEKICNQVSDTYAVIVTSDHGGHERNHGDDVEEDMTIPVFLSGNAISEGKILQDVSILDLAPTVTDILGMQPDRDWEGKSLLC